MKSTEMIKTCLNGSGSYRLARYFCLVLVMLVAFVAVSISPARAAIDIDVEIGDQSAVSKAVNFGGVKIGASRSLIVSIKNSGDAEITLEEIVGVNSPFSYEILGSDSIQPTESAKLLVTFEPKNPGTYKDVISFLIYTDNYESITNLDITLSGYGISSAGVKVKNSIDFGNVNIGEEKSAVLTFTNTGNVVVKIVAVDLPEGVFTENIPSSILAYETFDALITFSPKLAKNYEQTLRVVYDNDLLVDEIELEGRGVDRSAPAVKVSTSRISFGEVPVGRSKTHTVTITNTGNVDVNIVAVDSPDSRFKVSNLSPGPLAEGEVKVVAVTFTPDGASDYSSLLRIVFDKELPSKEIALSGSGSDIEISPDSVNFGNLEMHDSVVRSVTISNVSDEAVEVKKIVAPALALFSFSGLDQGAVIPAGGGSLTFQVAFMSDRGGYFEDELGIDLGSVQASDTADSGESDPGTRYFVQLQASVNASFSVAENDTFTADSEYKVKACAASNKSGRLFVLLSHTPLSSGGIFAMDRNGNLVPLPVYDSSVWQNLWYMDAAAPGLELDLSQVDFRDLGCTLCQSQKVDEGAGLISFGGFGEILMAPSPDKESVNNAADFKYMPGILYMATYLKDPSVTGMFDFNEGLLEMQVLSINSLNGTWKVTSRYNDQNRMHPTQLVVTENGDGNISAVWPGYGVTMAYGTDKSGYVMNFSMGIYNYTFDITDLTADTFSGTYRCVANGEVLDKQPICGVRAGSGLDDWLCPEMEIKVADGDQIPDSEKDQTIAIFSGNDDMNTRPFKTDGPWEIQWDVNGDMYGISIYASNGSLVDYISNSSNQGASYQTRTGEYYLGTTVTGSWKIKIISVQ